MSLSSYVYREHHSTQSDAPLLIVFHGTGGDEGQLFGLGRELMPHARVVAPRGDVSENGALRYFRRTGEGVYDMADLATRTEQMAQFINALTASGPVYGLGYSNGANILASVMLSHPDIFSAAALMHPLIPWTPADVPQLADRRVLITAGRHDPIAPAHATQQLADYFARQGAQVETVWHGGGHEVGSDEIAALQSFFAS